MPPRRKRPSTTVHPNGALETTFRVQVVDPPVARTRSERTRNRRVAAQEQDAARATAVPQRGAHGDSTARGPAPGHATGATADDGRNYEDDANERPRESTGEQGSDAGVTAALNVRSNTVHFAEDNPFLVSPDDTPADAVPLPRAQTPPTSPGEEFDSPDVSPHTTPSRSPHPRGTPRAGPHSRQRRTSTQRVGSKAGNKAKDVWIFFKDDGAQRRSCVFCRKQHSADPTHSVAKFSKTSSTSTLRKHLYDYHPDDWVEACDKLKIPIKAQAAQAAVNEYRARQEQSTQNPNAHTKPKCAFSHEAFVDAIVDFIVADDQSINVIENPELRAIFLMLREELRDSDIPHRTTIRNRVLQVWDEHLDRLEDQMKKALGKISTTMDMWSDPNLAPFMAVTAHWIEAQVKQTPKGPQYILTLRADLIGFIRVPGRHTGEHLAHAFLYVLDRIGITSKLGWVTLDNASNNDTFMMALESKLRARNIPFDKIERRIRCFPHVVNLACKAVLTAISETHYLPGGPRHDPIATIRALIRVIRASSIRRQYFSSVAKLLKQDFQLLRDVETRWSSTLLMIERALRLRGVIAQFLANDDFEELRRYTLDDVDWEDLQAFKKILAVPHAFQQNLSAEKTPTLCDAIPSFEAMIRVWEGQKISNPEMSQIIQAGLDKLSDYRDRIDCVPAHISAMIINPNMKLRQLSQFVPGGVGAARASFIRELRPYHITNTINTPARPRHLSDEPDDNWANALLGIDGPRNENQPRTLDEEVDAYLLDTQVGTDSITYWQENQLRYPTIFSFAMDILPIQGSAVPCERVFSSAKETTTARRNRINHDLMEALQMLKFSYKKGRSLDFTEGTGKEAELKELETEVDEEIPIPEDILAYIASLPVE